ncbi:MAG TPA: LptF/LptG family permease [Opitutaceae bacterium]|nr:LptF/LptG family permease [Opitutaceae bacterium]
MNTFDRHLLREWLQILGLVLAAMCGLLLVQVLYDDFQWLRDRGARGWLLWKVVFATLPSFLAIVLPIALLVSLLYTLGRLHRGNELTAMRAAGVGFLRLTGPVWIVGALCCGLMWFLNTTVVPWSVEQSQALHEAVAFAHESNTGQAEDRIGAVESVAFDNRPARRMWFFNRYSKLARRGYGVSVSELDAQRREVRRLLASEGWFDAARDGWVFRAGRELTFTPETGELIESKPFDERFAANFHEKPELMLELTLRPIDLSRRQLQEVIAYLEVQHNPQAVAYAVRYFGLIADTLAPLIVIAIAIPFAVTGVRVNPAVGVSKSIGLFLLYSALTSIATSLATQQLVEPAFAAWLPNAGMALLALWLFVRLR